MATIKQILTPKQAKQFDLPPKFNVDEQEKVFSVQGKAKTYLQSLRNEVSKLEFLLQYGYFRARGRFFNSKDAQNGDIKYLINRYFFTSLKSARKNVSEINALKEKFNIVNQKRHQDEVLRIENWKRLDKPSEDALLNHSQIQAQKLNGPIQLFDSIQEYCFENRLVIPTYNQLCQMVSACYSDIESTLVKHVAKGLKEEHKKALLNLLKKEGSNESLLAAAKKVDQSLNATTFRENAKKIEEFKQLFYGIEQTLHELQLPDQAITYYARWITKNPTSQVKQLKDKNKVCLYLMAFVKYQLFIRQDFAMDGFEKAIQSALNHDLIH